jgi:hypothetical protein
MTARTGTSGRTRRSQRTPKGKKELEEWLATPVTGSALCGTILHQTGVHG